MKQEQLTNTRQDPFFQDGLVQQPFYNSGLQGQQIYPGVQGGYPNNSTALVNPGAAAATTGSSFNIGQIKAVIDRMGGFEGMMGHVGRIQKFISSIQQMSPMIKVLMGSFGSKAKTSSGGNYSSSRRRRRPVKSSAKRTYKRRSR